MVALAYDKRRITELCAEWKIAEMALFGSVLREDFTSESDVDVLVTFSKDAKWSLFDLLRLESQLSEVLNRRVDLVSRRGLERSRNEQRRKAILETAEPIYVS